MRWDQWVNSDSRYLDFDSDLIWFGCETRSKLLSCHGPSHVMSLSEYICHCNCTWTAELLNCWASFIHWCRYNRSCSLGGSVLLHAEEYWSNSSGPVGTSVTRAQNHRTSWAANRKWNVLIFWHWFWTCECWNKRAKPSHAQHEQRQSHEWI